MTAICSLTVLFFAFKVEANQNLSADLVSQYFLGKKYLDGDEVGKNYPAALKWLTKAAEGGHPEAQFFLGSMYMKGLGTKKNPVLERKWLRKSAKLGFSRAMFVLGHRYYYGRYGFAVDYSKANLWFKKAAEKGHARAMYALAVQYGLGKGVDKNLAVANGWLGKAAHANSFIAQYNLGKSYLEGLAGLEIDHQQAALWIWRSAEAGYGKAQYQLGLMYFEGMGLERNFREAYHWLSLAADQDIEGATLAKIRVVLKLTLDDIKAKKRVPSSTTGE